MTTMTTNAHHDTHETFKLGEFTVPRLWTGLWQLSSNAWGTAPVSKIRQAMGRYVESGYMAFGWSISIAAPRIWH
jgi:hypothetical protein